MQRQGAFGIVFDAVNQPGVPVSPAQAEAGRPERCRRQRRRRGWDGAVLCQVQKAACQRRPRCCMSQQALCLFSIPLVLGTGTRQVHQYHRQHTLQAKGGGDAVPRDRQHFPRAEVRRALPHNHWQHSPTLLPVNLMGNSSVWASTPHHKLNLLVLKNSGKAAARRAAANTPKQQPLAPGANNAAGRRFPSPKRNLERSAGPRYTGSRQLAIPSCRTALCTALFAA